MSKLFYLTLGISQHRGEMFSQAYIIASYIKIFKNTTIIMAHTGDRKLNTNNNKFTPMWPCIDIPITIIKMYKI